MTYGTFDPTRQQTNKYPKKKYFNISEGTHLFRILPPHGSLAQKGQLAMYWSLFWMRGSDGKNRPVVSTRRLDRNKNVVVPDPVFDKVEALKVSLEQMIKNQENPIMIEKVKATIDSLNLDKAYYMNAMNPQGEIGILKVRYTAFQALQKRMGELWAEGVDPVNVGPGKGVFFEFKRYKDEKGKTIYEVMPATKKTRTPEGKLISEYLEAPIDENVMNRVKTEGADLANLYTPRNAEEMIALATLDPLMVDRVFARPIETEDGPDVDDAGPLTVPSGITVGQPAVGNGASSPGILVNAVTGGPLPPGAVQTNVPNFIGYSQSVDVGGSTLKAQPATPSVSAAPGSPLTNEQIQNILFGQGK